MKQEVESHRHLQEQDKFLRELPDEMCGFFAKNIRDSGAQLRQDLFVLWETRKKKGGYFIEIGACDGILYSNTLLLEKKYGWKGLVVEPARKWHLALGENRNCQISHDFVAGKSGKKMDFCEVNEGEFSSALQHADSDRHADLRRRREVYQVESVSLTDLLRKHSAPFRIDYLSLDTEGSELDILQGFDFDSYQVQCITCEHNFTSRREKIRQLLQGHGYTRKYEAFSHFDDWYFKA